MQQVAEQGVSEVTEEGGGPSLLHVCQPLPSRGGCRLPAQRPQSLAARGLPCSLSTLLLERFLCFLRSLHSQAQFTFLSMKRTQVWLSSEKYVPHSFRMCWTPHSPVANVSQQGKHVGKTAFIGKALEFVLCSLPVWREGQTPAAHLVSRRGDAQGALLPEACSGGASSQTF